MKHKKTEMTNVWVSEEVRLELMRRVDMMKGIEIIHRDEVGKYVTIRKKSVDNLIRQFLEMEPDQEVMGRKTALRRYAEWEQSEAYRLGLTIEELRKQHVAEFNARTQAAREELERGPKTDQYLYPPPEV